MTRLTLTAAAAALALAAASIVPAAMAQTAPAKTVASAQPTPGSEEWLRLRGETNTPAPDSEQDPVELAATARLNAEIAARNQAAEQAEAKGQTVYEEQNARWREETARLATEQAQWEANQAAANAARAQYERDRAAWEAEVAACERSGRLCVTTPKG